MRWFSNIFMYPDKHEKEKIGGSENHYVKLIINPLFKKWDLCYTAHIVNIRSLCKVQFTIFQEIDMWTRPAATEMRFGFEVTMYVMNK